MVAVGKAYLCLEQCPNHHAVLLFSPHAGLLLNTAQKTERQNHATVGGKSMCFLLIPCTVTGRSPVLSILDQPLSVSLCS